MTDPAARPHISRLDFVESALPSLGQSSVVADNDTLLENSEAASAILAGAERVMSLRFQIGQIVFHTWKPRLVLTYHSRTAPQLPAHIRNNLKQDLNPAAAGILVRGLPSRHFQAGIHRHADVIEYIPRHEKSYLVDIEGTFDAYLATTLSAKSRQNITRAVRKFKALNPDIPVLDVCTEPAEMSYFLKCAAMVSCQTYQTQLLDVGLANTPDRLDHLQRTARAGDARGYLLRLHGKAIAFAWCRHRNGALIYDVIGYLPDQAHHSPGIVLLYLILEELFSIKKYHTLDFGSGDAHYKSMLSTREELLVDSYMFRRTFRNNALLTLHGLVFRMSVGISRFLDHVGLKAIAAR